MMGYLQVAPTYQGADILDGRGRVIARCPARDGANTVRLAKVLAAAPKLADALNGLMALTMDSRVIDSPEWQLAQDVMQDIARVQEQPPCA